MKKKKSESLQKFSVSDREFLSRKPKSTTRYSKVSSKTNSGYNATRQMEIEKEIRKYYKVRNNNDR